MNSVILWSFLALFSFFPENLFAQEIRVAGFVTDRNNQPLPAMIEVKNSYSDSIRTRFLANERGAFEVLIYRDEVLVFSHLGYEIQELTAFAASPVRIKMSESVTELEVAVVFGDRAVIGSRESSMSDLIVSKEEIQNSQSLTFAGALEKIPGVSSINLGVGVAKPVIRGLGFNRILVNDKGIKQEGQQWGADHGLEIDAHDVERLEILKGPNSLKYGPDAMGGVLNILPEQPLHRDGLEGEASFDHQSNSQYFGQSVHVKGRIDNWYSMGRLTHSSHGDYQVPAESYVYAGYVLPIFNERLKNTAGNALHFSATVGKILSHGKSQVTVSRFGQQAGIFTGAVGIPTAFSLEDDGNSRDIGLPRQLNTHWKVISNTQWTSGNRAMEMDLGFQRNIRHEESFPHIHGVGPTPSGNLALGLDLSTFTANYREVLHLNKDTRLSYGLMGQTMRNGYQGFEFLLPAYSSHLAGVYLILNQSIEDRFHWNAGLRLDGNILNIEEHLQAVYNRLEPTGEFDQRNPDVEKRTLSPSFSGGISWEINPSNSLKVNFGSGVRFPTPIELASNGIHHGNFRHEIGDKNLVTERSYQIDLSYGWSSENFSFGISPFGSVYRGYIYLAPSGRFSPLPGSSTLWEYKQDDATFFGGEFSAAYKSPFHVDFRLGMDYVWNYNLVSNLPLPLTPPFSLLSGITYKRDVKIGILEKIVLELDFRQVAAQNMVARNERTTAGSQLIDLTMRASIKLGKNPLEINFGVKNLTHQSYFNHLSRYRLINIPEPGRNFIVGLSIPFMNIH
ncbi:hypothetical protein P872_22235 [Rhodonellum psychrophilum GCM71 = DSM 17998]|uniref:TonB-denpendent receptor n=2 Tax=Rhodonellum TaxID=336827 RepID=U5BQQ5_9BACT|nr:MULTISPECIES: TonB-dependent receptor [Rhodonellum]ERM80248.1 hypothetical protein P872_22235 [Rhodonellum psychrophilum GCM71 = DSM 17998]